jgi:hypothetical protein
MYQFSRDFFHYELVYKSKKSRARVGRIHTPHGIINTPGTYMYVSTDTSMQIHVCIYSYKYADTCMYLQIHVCRYMYVQIHVCTDACMCLQIHVCTDTCMYLRIHVCIYSMRTCITYRKQELHAYTNIRHN